MPGELKKKADGKWEAEIRRKPWMRNADRQNEEKFGYLGLGEMVRVTTYGNNWEQIFEEAFGDKAYFDRRINDIKVLRDPVSHDRQMDDQDVQDGKTGLYWLARCINDQTLNPYL